MTATQRRVGARLTRNTPAAAASKRRRAVARCRAARCVGCGTKQCDEYPFASTRNPTRHVMMVDQRQNSSHGAWLGAQYRRFRITNGTII